MRRSYNKPFKGAAVKLVLEHDMSVSDASKTLGIHYNSLYNWISEYEKYGESADRESSFRALSMKPLNKLRMKSLNILSA